MDEDKKKSPKYGKSVGIHHANIRNKEKVVQRLRSGFRKVHIKMEMEKTRENVDAELVLCEVSTKSAYLFCRRKMKKKTNLIFRLSQPLALSVRAVVRYCERLDHHSAVQIKKDTPYFRMYLEFMIASEAEKRALEDLYQKIRDENYVATQWHIYVTEKMQNEKRIRLQTEKLNKTIAEASDAKTPAEKLEDSDKKKAA